MFNKWRKAGEPVIKWLDLQQPVQTPDTNKNDLGFYSSIDSKLPQYRDFDLDAFSAQVLSAFDAYDPQLLTNIDSAKKIVLSRIIEFKGDNNFNYHRRSGE